MVRQWDLVTPNPKLKLVDQVREVMRLKHYPIRTETAYGDWIRRYIKFHGMRSDQNSWMVISRKETSALFPPCIWRPISPRWGIAASGSV